MTDAEMALKLAEEIDKKGGNAYYVGGFVRDSVLGKESKDIDIEIHGITNDTLIEILDSLGHRMIIGESFGVYALKGYSIDIAFPRKERQTGNKHTDFEISLDPFIGTYKACMRRDFTINSMMKNVLTGEIIDHFGGLEDLKQGIIRHTNVETFKEDPLRVLRGCQFASRFGFKIHDDTIKLCSELDLSTLSKERVFAELQKALLKSDKPSVFFEYLREMNQLKTFFPELENLIDVVQNKKYHGEGDVWNHTMMVLDECAKLREKVNNKTGFMLSALTHDFGKAVCTEIREDGKIISYGHEIQGIPLVKTFLSRITNEKSLIQYVTNMTKLHMRPNALADLNAKTKSTNRLFDESCDPLDLVYLSIGDNYGRISEDGIIDHSPYLFEKLNIYEEMMKLPYVSGEDLINMGLKPGKDFSLYLEYAHKLRLNGTPKEQALKEVKQYIKNTERKNGNI